VNNTTQDYLEQMVNQEMRAVAAGYQFQVRKSVQHDESTPNEMCAWKRNMLFAYSVKIKYFELISELES
jgi:hypothetical protein